MKDKKDKLDTLLGKYYEHKRGIQKRDAVLNEPKTDYLAVTPRSAVRKPAGGRKPATAHPPLAILGAYIDGTLDEREKAKTHQHIGLTDI